MQCPRCEREIDALARSCGACALPLAIEEEGAVEPVERVIEIDRRRSGRTPLPDPLPASEERENLPARTVELEPELELELEPELEPELELDRDRRPRARRALAWLIDAALVAAFVAVPLLLASGAHPAAALRGALLPAAGLLAVLAVAYGALCHALAGATLGQLALFTKRGRAPRDPAPGTAVLRA